MLYKPPLASALDLYFDAFSLSCSDGLGATVIMML